jgi:NAD(P)-dependent dehydrogenase (short-subunit alcohol dehydrogenase family)
MNVLIIGGGRGIGAALAKQLIQSNHQVIKTSRQFNELVQHNDNDWTVHCDVNDENSINQLNARLHEKFSHIDWLINCAGVLHSDEFMPEKALSQINMNQLAINFSTNAVGHLLVIKALKTLITQATHPLITSISARIGSIEDNHLGGWYAYRMSKAALNMGLKTLAIEWHRRHPKVKFLSLHPGTTDTDLSAPFQKSLPQGQLQTVESTASMLLEQMQLNKQHHSKYPLFLDYKGQKIPW